MSMRLDLPLTSEPDDRFTGTSEKEFRAWFYARNAQRAHLTLGLAQALVLLTAGVDLLAAQEGARLWVLIKLVVICPLPFITLWVYRQQRWKHLYPHFMCASILAVGLAFSLISIGGEGLSFRPRYDTLLLITVFAYFLGGLASNLACLTGLTLLGVYVAASYGAQTPLPQMAYEGLFLLAVNAIGMFSANNMEFSVHEAFARARVLTDLSERDPLTDLLNRRGFEDRLQMIWRQAQRAAKPIAVAMIDLDHFKGVNDRLGHAAGDLALREVAEVLRSNATRPLDASVRWGGEEFVVVWYDVSRDEAQRLAERVRSSVESLRLSNESAPAGVLTVSVGVCVRDPDMRMRPYDCIEAADQAQYQAKQAGRNRVVFAETSGGGQFPPGGAGSSRR